MMNVNATRQVQCATDSFTHGLAQAPCNRPEIDTNVAPIVIIRPALCYMHPLFSTVFASSH